jgi:GNAT superfamily N-acetyltransferase
LVRIRRILKSEITLLKDFPPEDWNTDLPALISYHYGFPYFYPIIAEKEGKVVGCANGILNNKVGWLGDIIVLREHRNKGIGYELTKHLIEYFDEKGCTSKLLVATEMGERVYKKLGFEVSSTYRFFDEGTDLKSYPENENIRKITENDFAQLGKFDEEITGEQRYDFIKRFFLTGWVYAETNSNRIEGVYLPGLGSGLIFARNDETGLELLKFKLSTSKAKIVIPSRNKTAQEFLKNEGYQSYSTAPRMFLGSEVNWKPESMVFADKCTAFHFF